MNDELKFNPRVEQGILDYLQEVRTALGGTQESSQHAQIILDELEVHIREDLMKSFGVEAVMENLKSLLSKMDHPSTYGPGRVPPVLPPAGEYVRDAQSTEPQVSKGILYGLLTKHSRRYQNRTPWGFCWRITVEGLIISLGLGVLLLWIGFPDRKIHVPFEKLVVLALVWAPLMETLVLQGLPVGIARMCHAGVHLQMIASTALFFLAHVSEGITTAICAGLIGGYYFAFTYVRWRAVGWWTAFWVTAVSHLLHNAVALMLVAMGL